MPQFNHLAPGLPLLIIVNANINQAAILGESLWMLEELPPGGLIGVGEVSHPNPCACILR